MSGLDAEPDGYRYHHATRAELLRRAGDLESARASFERALELTTTDAERRFLRARLDLVPPP